MFETERADFNGFQGGFEVFLRRFQEILSWSQANFEWISRWFKGDFEAVYKVWNQIEIPFLEIEKSLLFVLWLSSWDGWETKYLHDFSY